MKFKQFIAEEFGPYPSEKLVRDIKKNCSQFLKESEGLPMYRGSSVADADYIKTYGSSESKDSSLMLTSLIDLYVEEKFNIEGARTTHRIYCTGYFGHAADYGVVHYIFPVNGYKYVWSPEVLDATNELEAIAEQEIAHLMRPKYENSDPDEEGILDELGHLAHEHGPLTLSVVKDNEIYKHIKPYLIKYFDKLDFSDKHLGTGLSSGNEINFVTKGYYQIAVCEAAGIEDDESNIILNKKAIKYYNKLYKQLT